MTTITTGLSGIALYLPPYRVDLQRWCEWTGADWNKISQVVGTGFRLLGPRQSIYTMAANAVLRLIQQNDIDPGRVGYLGLGTESSTDNSAGAIIVKGMVDTALKGLGLPPLSRNCEVPEFKHACLGGIYGLKNALRFLSTDGRDSLAIIVCADKALYERGSSGEPTQGAGATAMLLNCNPSIATIDLQQAGTASEYRSVDFRKPLINRNGTEASPEFVEIPVFNGKYSTNCYVDEMQQALADMSRKRGGKPIDHLRSPAAIFMHRPYQRMPETGLSMAYLFALATGDDSDHQQLVEICTVADVSPEVLLQEINSAPNFVNFTVPERISEEVFPLCQKALRASRHMETFARDIRAKISLGANRILELGNLYTAALPAWLAAGLEDAHAQNIELADQEILLIGYGSGDAADAIPMHVVAGWQHAVSKINFDAVMEPCIDLSHDQYLALHESSAPSELSYSPKAEFIIDRVGSERNAAFQDAGIEYYLYIQ
ncbi:MAG: hydroxymethylglutaryl-CoA synthase [Gammaproteobacteria bacterium]|jgi:hydroxymethylglutaryl-CoA synthase|nr:hydroxymethylglutaryl-CoA synthase [Chromatiales bacterium]MCP4926760.1 hydroxymethylglutaryl-CoA synthase family protein [Gammaproteobacteria bacterium]MDP7296722.1 hydroxymethylglutaryl-CoA synthase [Gammaproteobacteria bacterium]MDP7419048.1 hydroxymethylglutaryl-CoA synthase [Gammaproteobacteria bacterium]MDP7660336.1 hydroxymethylglutaryl-CoA synthase [Gammaproteobacteria bacterium]